MKVSIAYRYSAALSRRLFIDQAKEASSTMLTLDHATLTPAGRQALLDARVVPLDWKGEPTRPADWKECPPFAAKVCNLALQVPEPTDTEPDGPRAVADIERLLLELVQGTPQVEAEWAAQVAAREARAAAEAAEKATQRAESVARIREQGIDALLRRNDDGEWFCTYARDHHDRNVLCREALGDDVEERAVAEAVGRNETEYVTRHAAETAWLAEHAPELVARHQEGYLGESELLARVRDVTFADLASFGRYGRIAAGDLWHSDECADPQPKFHVCEATELTADEYAHLEKIRHLRPEGATIEVRSHTGWCESCDSKYEHEIERRSARVMATVLGRVVSREYAL